MASDFYRIKILEVSGASVKARVSIISPEVDELPETKEFALRLLWEEADNRFRDDKTDLGTAVSVDDIMDEDFVREHAEQFITSVKLIDTRNYPLTEQDREEIIQTKIEQYLRRHTLGEDDDYEDEEELYWSFYDEFYENEENIPQGTYKIVATDAKWTKHLKKGMEWETSAYG